MRTSVILLADRTRPGMAELIPAVRRHIEAHARIAAEMDVNDGPLPGHVRADLAVVLGGDGTLIGQARRTIDLGLPLVGVNFGRLGFLAEFDVASLLEHAPRIFGGDPPIQEHMVLATEIRDEAGRILEKGIALNECVITAGPPYRMVEIGIAIDGAAGPTLNGDGVIVATPTGSTAYSASAGGPIVHRAVDCLIITPLAAHSLAFRPIVAPAESTLRLTMTRANQGTTIVLDGQVARPLHEGMSVVVGRHPRKARFVVNPTTTYWGILIDKLRWAAPPTYR